MPSQRKTATGALAAATAPRKRIPVLAAVVCSLLLGSLLALPLDRATLPEIAKFAGRLHPMLLHLPIGFVVALAVLEVVARFRRSPGPTTGPRALLWLAALSAVPSAVAGALLAAEGGYDPELLSLHRQLGVATAILTVWLLALRPAPAAKWWSGRSLLYYGLLAVALATLTGTGHFGASLTHGSDYLAEYASFLGPSENTDATHTDPESDQPGADPDGDVFADTVQPVLADKCVRCHGPDKQKAGLRLDSLTALMQGSDDGAVVVVGNPGRSPLVTALLLPQDRDGHMPPDGKPQLSTGEIDAILSWIEHGTGEPEPVTQPMARTGADGSEFQEVIQPLLSRYCFGCHGEDEQEADIRLDVLDPDMVHGPDAQRWHAALDMINGGEMPPDDEPQPDDEERRRLVAWMTASLKEAATARQGERRTVLRRLTKAQYTNTLQDLLGVPIDFGRVLPDDGKSATGFSNSGEVLRASPLHIEYYQQIARTALDQALAIGEKPPVSRYRVTFGKGIGKGLVAGRTGGYQSVPLDPDDFKVEILGTEGESVADADEIKRRISVGLRGSSQDRFRIVDEGMLLFSALPHREKVPKSWQGPSPNLKLEMQRCFPEAGDFAMRVVASRGYIPTTREQLLVSLDDPVPLAALDATRGLTAPDEAIVLAAASSDQRRNLRMDGDALVPVDVPKASSARFSITLPEDGFYQIDLVHPVSADAMPSVRLSVDNLNLDLRPEPTEEQRGLGRIVTPLGAAGLRAGEHRLKVGGPFFVGFSHVVVTQLPTDHPLVARLTAETDELTAGLADKAPAIRAFVGTRTDDGMDYATFDDPQEVHAPFGQAETYTFVGRLENLPIPEPESGDTEILSGFMLLGLWNDHLVKSRDQSGPPLLVESIEFEAPYFPVWPPPSHEDIFFASPNAADEEAYTREIVARFVERAFRRPPTAGEIERYLEFWRDVRGDHARYEHGVREVLVAVLCSPSFLYLAEPVDDPLAEDALSGHALATRLSYFLWNSPPDRILCDLALEGRLAAELTSQVDRMLEDPRAWRFVRAFAHEWLRLDRHEGVTVNVDAHPAYTRFVKRDMADETYHFVHHVLQQDLSIFTLIDSDFAMLNQNLAEFYGIDGVAGAHFRPVPVTPEQRRGGLLSQGAFLSGHSDGTWPHPIKRAVWLKEKILDDPPPPPPPNVPDLDPDTPGFDKLTLKEQLEIHRDKASCRDCHASIDPYGVVFERYSAVGRLQEKRRGLPIDAHSILPDGTGIDGVDELKAWILEQQRDTFANSLIAHLFAYALGRDVHFADEEELAMILRQVKVAGYRMRSVIRSIATSPSFTQR